MSEAAASIDRAGLLAAYDANRRRTRALFDAVEEAYLERPIPLRHPIVFYEGHIPAFAVNTLLKRGLGRPGIREDFETLFARGIDPEDVHAMAAAPPWPTRAEVLAYAEAADEAVRQALAREPLDREDRPLLRGGEAVFTVLEHELMHQETLLYMFRELAPELRRGLASEALVTGGAPPPRSTVRVPAGRALLGRARGDGFGWDNEFPAHAVDVPAFTIDVHDVTNADFLEFVAAGGYRRPELWSPEGWEWLARTGKCRPHLWAERDGVFFWRSFGGEVPLPEAWPVWVSGVEAAAYARWRGQRLPSEAELHRAAYGTPEGEERPFPWGDAPPDATRGCFDFAGRDPSPAGSHPEGRSAWGVHDLLGNGWEWTWTPFEGFPGFVPMPSYPEYSADFFDGKHCVLKGGSPATAAPLLRKTFRNWFRPTYPWVWAAFRCVSSVV